MRGNRIFKILCVIMLFTVSFGPVIAEAKTSIISQAVSVKGLIANTKQLNIKTGQKVVIKITATYSNKKTRDVTKEMKWKTENGKVAIISGVAIVAKGKGITKVIGKYSTKTISIAIMVKENGKLPPKIPIDPIKPTPPVVNPTPAPVPVPTPVPPVVDSSYSFSTKDTDTDGDGISDFQEIHKYFTNPNRSDSDGDGIPDSKGDERREYTYSIKTKMYVLKPINPDYLMDDYQDARVIKDFGDYVELEVIAYPLNTNKDAIQGNPNWREDDKDLAAYTKPTITANWDEKMRTELLTKLADSGIHPENLNDKELVEKVSSWILNTSNYVNQFTTYMTTFNNGKPEVYPSLRQVFEENKGDKGWSDQTQFENDMLGKEMFYNNTHGACTSSSVYWTTIFRALGIPTRTIITTPPIDANDTRQIDMIKNNIHHNKVRQVMVEGTEKIAGSFAAHTYNEVFVGGRWVRLNYDRLGQNILDVNFNGLMIHINTFEDLATQPLAEMWASYVYTDKFKKFSSFNPYQTLEINDLFGSHATIENPEVKVEELTTLTVDQALWKDDSAIPKWAALIPEDDFLISYKEWISSQDYHQMRKIEAVIGQKFVLTAEGYPEIHASLSHNKFSSGSGSWQSFGIHIDDMSEMVSGVAYKIRPINISDKYKWVVLDGVRVTKP